MKHKPIFPIPDAAIFPRLALNDPKVRTARREMMPPAEYSALESITRNHYSTISTTWSNIGFLMISVILIGVFQGLAKSWGTDANSLPNFSYVFQFEPIGIYYISLMALTTGYTDSPLQVLCAVVSGLSVPFLGSLSRKSDLASLFQVTKAIWPKVGFLRKYHIFKMVKQTDTDWLIWGIHSIKAFKECRRLPQTFWYLLGYFVLAG